MSENESQIIETKIYNIYDISDEKFEEYINSPEWKELDELFKKVSHGDDTTDVSTLIEIISYGEIVRVKYNDFFNYPENCEGLAIIFVFLPILMDMPYKLAVNVIKDWVSDDKKRKDLAFETIMDYTKDHQIEELIEYLKITINDNDYDSVEDTLDKIYEIGKHALPRLKLIMINQELPLEVLSGVNQVIIHLSIGDKKAEELSNRLYDKNPDIYIPALDEMDKIIKKIDLEPYFERHPEKIIRIE